MRLRFGMNSINRPKRLKISYTHNIRQTKSESKYILFVYLFFDYKTVIQFGTAKLINTHIKSKSSLTHPKFLSLNTYILTFQNHKFETRF